MGQHYDAVRVTLLCAECGEAFTKLKSKVTAATKFCSRKCHYSATSSGEYVTNCGACGKQVVSTFARLKLSKSGNLFCSRSCSSAFNKNAHRGTHNGATKLEEYIAGRLERGYPDTRFILRGMQEIGAELDFYFPDLRLAIELHGPLHYRPIFGDGQLKEIRDRDCARRVLCAEADIRLVEIDISYYNRDERTMDYVFETLVLPELVE